MLYLRRLGLLLAPLVAGLLEHFLGLRSVLPWPKLWINQSTSEALENAPWYTAQQGYRKSGAHQGEWCLLMTSCSGVLAILVGQDLLTKCCGKYHREIYIHKSLVVTVYSLLQASVLGLAQVGTGLAAHTSC